ncbi:MAG: S1 RNA-binding domain-containing protein [Candidatus Colwellbacteria bacterium]|nr:S1 RNA-binding domain-containing protein [Candidatus Colwellbacteria bacterium]
METTTTKKDSLQMQILKGDALSMPLLKHGDLTDVRLLEKTSKGVFFEIPKVGTGVLYGAELANAREILKKMKVGDSATAKVVLAENKDGLVELSLAEAGAQKVWAELKELKEKDEPIKVKIINANAGGLIADISGLSAFLPSSQLSNENYPSGLDMQAGEDRTKLAEELKKFIGQEFTVKVLNINPRSGKLIISEREVVSQNVKELVEKYNAGDVVSGIVSGVTNFGAFIKFADQPEIEGLIHISELGHRLIENPKEIVAIGDMVRAKIIDIKDGKVSLSLKALQVDPWAKAAEKFKEGGSIKGTVYKLNPFGAIIMLGGDITGLIHVSEFGSTEELKKNLTVGKEYNFLIDSVKPENKRIILKLASEKSV